MSQERTVVSFTPHGRTCPTCGMKLEAGVNVCPKDGTNVNQPSVFSTDPAFRGKYRFLETIGSGGMGVIYKAQQLILNKLVAIKMVHAHLVSPEAFQRFQREGRATSVLEHPLIITVHDLGITEAGQPYMVMDFVPGGTLAQAIEQSTRLSTARFLRIFIQVTAALAHAHKRSVTHRDIKPSNIMLLRNEEGEEEVRIMDFGIAKMLTDTEDGAQALTKTGEAVGSPLYMSPEQARGTRVDARTDIYSLGCVMYECLTGSVPFRGNTQIDTMLMHLEKKPDSLKEASLGLDFDPHIEMLVMKLLEKNPDDRYQTMDEIHRDLRHIQDKVLFGTTDVELVGLAGIAKPAEAPARKGLSTKTWIILGTCATLILIAVPVCILEFSQSRQKQQVADSFKEETVQPADSTKGAAVKADPDKEFDADKMIANELEARKSRIQLDNLADFESISKQQLMPIAKATWADNVHLRQIATDQNLEAISGLKLKELHLLDSGVRDLHAIKDMQTLEKLMLQSSTVDSDGIKIIGGLKHLQTLNLNNTQITDSDLRYLYDSPSLEFVDVSRCKNLTPSGINALRLHLAKASVVSDQSQSESLLTFQGDAAMKAEDWKSADEWFAKAEEAAIKDPACDPRVYAGILQSRGQCQVQLRNFGAAGKLFERATVPLENNHIHNFQLPLLLAQSAQIQEIDGRPDKAAGTRKFADDEWAKLPPGTPPFSYFEEDSRLENLELMIVDLETAIPKDAQDLQRQDLLDEKRSQLRANIPEDKKELVKAKQLFAQLQAQAGSSDNPVREASRLVAVGDALSLMSKNTEAMDRFVKARKLLAGIAAGSSQNAENSQNSTDSKNAAENSEKSQNAKNSAENSAKTSPENSPETSNDTVDRITMRIANIEFEQGHYAQSEEELRHLLLRHLKPKLRETATKLLASSLHKQGKDEEAARISKSSS